MADTEEYFPRGGKKPTTTYFKQSANFLGAPEKGEKKRKKLKKPADGDDGYLSDEGTKEIDIAFRHCAHGLSYKTVKEGLLILGRVKDIFDTKLVISLPCRLIGSVMACHISEAYNKLLEEYVNDKSEKIVELDKMFRLGQYVAVKVLEVQGVSLMLSMMPQHVNGQKTHVDLQKGSLIQAAVSSVEDHGYVMDVGIDNTRAFLPKSNTNPEIELDVGMICWCSVKAAPSAAGGVVTLSNELVALQNSWLRKSNAALLPGSALDFFVDTPLENGIEGHVFGDTTAYIQRQHADTVKGKKPALGQKIRARLLYVMPTRNTPFLTMKDIFESTYPDLAAEQTLKDGDIVDEAQVLKITGRSIHFRLGNGCYGTMSLKRIQVDEDLTDEEVVAKSYPIGSRHKVRVLCYNLSDWVYSVSDEPGVLAEQVFSRAGLAPGRLLPARVARVAPTHLLLSVGRVTGYVSQAHMTDTGIVEQTKKTVSNLSKKFKVGQEVTARVLVSNPRALFLTLKPALLDPDLPLLCSYSDAEIGKAYTGVIKTIRDYVLVSFFNDVLAYVSRQYVTREPLEDLTQAFHHGQIVKCTILKVDVEAKKMVGSLTTAPFWPNAKLSNKNKSKQKDHVANKKPKTKDAKEDNVQDKDQETNTEESGAELENSKKNKRKNKTVAEEQEEPASKKKKKNKQVTENTEDEKDTQEETQTKDKKKKKDKQVNQDSGNENVSTAEETQEDNQSRDEAQSSESDAINTDVIRARIERHAERNAALLDNTNCSDVPSCRRRVAMLVNAVNVAKHRLKKIDYKINRLQVLGLDATNIHLHTALFAEKVVLQEKVSKFLDALAVLQQKLKELEHKKKKEKKVNSDEDKTVKTKAIKKEDKKVVNVNEKSKDSVKDSKLEVKVVESLEPGLEMPSAKEFWSASGGGLPAAEAADTSSSDDEEENQPKKKRKKLSVAEKVAKAREEEERLRELERRAIESESQPRSSEQFERALLASPNCSQLWIAYMAFHLQATDIEKARNVARKALSTISFKEEQERLNVWVTLINLETRFGTKESQQKTLEEALQMNDPYTIHCKLLDIYVECGKAQELAALVELMLRKHRRPGVHVRAGAACYRLGLLDKARQVMQKAIAVLDKKEHVDTLVQFALLERDAGQRERAEALFEQLLGVYPRRSDVAAAYMHLLHKAGDTNRLRQVMERLTSQQLPARTMKILYKKWLEVEERIGDQAQIDSIRQRALQYVEKAKF
ncbi:protein RRP5 homolog [Trichoplusia ni]|uniref:rRNA biogenesis protein RRP5 n=1 Tax=Trichoplusia ni TaxID=7111 RepID=A0A7E5WR43_TRINI|nr:protein RRP5 homolog [Trichoplusia ni]